MKRLTVHSKVEKEVNDILGSIPNVQKHYLSNMKYLFILFTFMFLSCGESDNVVLSKTEYQTITNQDKLKPVYLGVVPDFPIEKFFIVEIDSCEYIMSTSFNNYGDLTSGMHKGNCKFCSQRNVKQLSQNNN